MNNKRKKKKKRKKREVRWFGDGVGHQPCPSQEL
jgi:hypothetical protein